MIDCARMHKAQPVSDVSAGSPRAFRGEGRGEHTEGWYEGMASPRLLRSALLSRLGVRHGFTTRRGGVSRGPFASLNLGESWGDEPAAVAANLQHVADEAGFDPARLCQVRQVHGRDVLTLTAPERRQREADGLATVSELALGVMSADCVSLLLGDGEGRVAAAHAGWRGTVSDIAAEAVAALVALGARPSSLRAAMAPSIGPCCFEVQADVAAQFAAVVPDSVEPRGGRTYVNLWRTNRALLLRAGLVPEHIELDPPCTCCDAERFYSYRRDGARRGGPGQAPGAPGWTPPGPLLGQHLAFICGGNS